MTAATAPTRTQESVTIRLISTPKEREAIASLRYEVYVQEMGRTQIHADPVARTIYEPMDKAGLIFGAFLPDGTAIGTLRLNASTDPALNCGDFYGWEERERSAPNQVFLASKLIISPSYRGQLLALELMRHGYRAALERGWRYAFLDANDHLVALYSRLGFRPLGRRDHVLYGRVTIMEWDSLDMDHMQVCRSPMLRDCLVFLSGAAKVA